MRGIRQAGATRTAECHGRAGEEGCERARGHTSTLAALPKPGHGRLKHGESRQGLVMRDPPRIDAEEERGCTQKRAPIRDHIPLTKNERRVFFLTLFCPFPSALRPCPQFRPPVTTEEMDWCRLLHKRSDLCHLALPLLPTSPPPSPPTDHWNGATEGSSSSSSPWSPPCMRRRRSCCSALPAT